MIDLPVQAGVVREPGRNLRLDTSLHLAGKRESSTRSSTDDPKAIPITEHVELQSRRSIKETPLRRTAQAGSRTSGSPQGCPAV
jgi:hypothetical protein